MAQDIKLEAAGLYVNPSDLQRPDGALSVADNIVIKREGVIEPRAGFRKFVSSELTGGDAQAIFAYKDGFLLFGPGYLAHTGASLSSETGALAEYAVAWDEIGWWWAIATGNIYISTNKGVYKKTYLSEQPYRAGSFMPWGFERDYRVITSGVNQMSLTSNVVTVNTSSPHQFYVGQQVTQTSATEAPYAQGTYTVTSTPTGTRFTYALVAGNDAGNANPHTFMPTQLNLTNGWLSDGEQVAYRAVFVTKDSNQTEIISAPSPRNIVGNTSAYVGYTASTKANPIVRIFYPSEFTPEQKATLVVRLYRSKAVAVAIEPSDEMGLVAEKVPTSLEQALGYIDFTDITPDALRGEALYTNPSQEGIEQANDIPPLMFSGSSMAFDGSRMLYSGDTARQQQIIVSLLAVGGTNGIQNNDFFVFGQSIQGVTGTPTASDQFKIETGGTDAQNIRNTALNMCAAINRQIDKAYSAYYLSGANEAPGKILIKAAAPDEPAFRLSTNNKRSAFFPEVGGATVGTFSFTRVGSTVTATVSSGTHNFKVGERVNVLLGTAAFPEGPWTIDSVTSTTFVYTESGTATTEAGKTVYSYDAPKSSNDAQFSRVYESKPFLPEAVPLLNYADVGDTTKRVWAMAVVRNQVFAFKEDGLFIRTAPLSWELFDETVRVVAPRSVVTLLNNVYAWTTQGIVAINDTGVEIVSRPIEKVFSDALNLYPSACKEKAFAVANELARTLHIYVPDSSANYPNQCYTYNTITRTWTRETVNGNNGLIRRFYGGAVGFDEYKKPYRAHLTTQGELVLQRNSGGSTDFQDIGGTPQTADIGVGSDYAIFSVNPGFAPGDIVFTDLGTTHIVSSVIDNVTEFEVYFTTSDVPGGATTFALAAPLLVDVQYAPVTAGNPDQLKMFRQANMLFQNAHIKTLTVEFSTELKTTAEAQTVDMQTLAGQWTSTWDGIERPHNQSILIPQEMRRATRLNVSFATAVPCQAFSVNGLSIRLNPSGDKVSK